MQPFRIHVMGCGSAHPTPRHFSSAQLVEVRNKVFLVDCAEGAQLLLRRTHCRFANISVIFISHLHGDHCLGLVGLISSLGLMGRTATLHVYAHGSFQDLFQQMMKFFCPNLSFVVSFHPIDTTAAKVIYEDKSVTVSTIPLEHRVPCCGFLFKEKEGMPHIRRDMLDFYKIPKCYIAGIKEGSGWVKDDGEVIPHERLVTPPDPVRTYAYCSDTRYIPNLHELLKGVNLLYHESTYDETCLHLAEKYYHSTAAQAAKVAKDAGVKHLLLGHYSARYSDEEVLKKEAETIFPNVSLANEGLIVDVV